MTNKGRPPLPESEKKILKFIKSKYLEVIEMIDKSNICAKKLKNIIVRALK